ncbi:heparanase-like protein 3 [Impatiens glandulifera]|uniref:heparanase-like protein 3 n=1 Tax=Impatiens glandulifera TaxID=253017 RepID=UPI001FB15383|nr:heparanase-like protein 3 [Impatiens glandulifera]
MVSIMKMLGICFCIYLVFIRSRSAVGANSDGLVEGIVVVNGTLAIAQIDEDFVCATLDWWPPEKCDYGLCSWANSSLLNLDLTNKIFINAIKEFSPLKLRLGGTLQDKLIYHTLGDTQPCGQFVKNNEMFGFSQGCLSMSRWDELNAFFNKTGAKVIFGLNALNGKTIGIDGSAIGAWNSTNAESFISYTVNKGYIIHGWELGNELSGKGIGASISSDQYAKDIISLQGLLEKTYKNFRVQPLLLGPGGFFDSNWFTDFINKSNNSLQVVTHHIYNLGPGVDDHLIDKILNPSYLSGGSQPFIALENILKNARTSTIAWVSEAGGAWNSGHPLVTNAFVFSFWYLDQLGMASVHNTKTYCRQTLIGGNYGLLNTTTFTPNPDYYSALLWHRLMGRNVLSTNMSTLTNIRAYSHCSKASTILILNAYLTQRGITILLINLDGNTTAKLSFKIDNSTIKGTNNKRKRIIHNTGRINFDPIWQRLKMKDGTREEYHLAAKDGDLHSQTVLLNGEALMVNSFREIPRLTPRVVNGSEPVTIAPFSIAFCHFPNIHVNACR